MIVRGLALLAVLALTSCGGAQAGCTKENCKKSIDACRVELGGGPTNLAVVTCTGIDRPTTPIDWSTYCVDSCLSQGSGVLIACIASKADTCLAAKPADRFKVIESCLTPGDGKSTEKTCEAKCRAEQDACDAKCGITRECDSCLRAGKSCASVCPTTGHLACLDCSVPCGRGYVLCTDFCPRE